MRKNSDHRPRRVDDATPVGPHRRPHRAVRERLPLRSYLLNAVAIAIAVLLAPALTRSSATVAVPRTEPVAVASPTVTQQQRFATEVPQPAPNRNGTRDEIDHDDTEVPPPPATLVATNGSDFVSPVPGAITGGFGQRYHPILHYWRMHNGVDMHAACGTVVVAAYRGTVIEAGRNGGYGNLVVLDHGSYKGKHVISKYAHLSRIGVRVGDRVDTGQGIALSGTTGLSTGCHLHFEIKENGVYVDPAPYLTGKSSPRPDGPIANLGPTTSPSPTRSPSPSASASPKPSASPTTKSPKPSPTPSKTSTSPTPTPTKPTPTPTPTPTRTPTPTPTPTPAPEQSASARTSASPSRPSPTPAKTEEASAPAPSGSQRQRTESPADPSPSGSTTP